MKIVAVRSGPALYPVDPRSQEIVSRVPANVEIVADVKQARNPRHLKAVHALLRTIADNHPDFLTARELERELKIRSGMWQPLLGANGKLFFELQSIAVEKMDQIEFAELWDRWLHIISTEIIPGLSVPAIEREILEAL